MSTDGMGGLTRTREWLTPLLVPATVCLFVATLLFSRQITAYLDTRNRFYLQFQTSDALAMIAAVCAVAALLFGVGALVDRWPRVRRGYDDVLVLVLAGGVFSVIPNRAESMWTGMLWIVVSAGWGTRSHRPTPG
jgi:uncharacterized membrane protein